MNNTSAIHAENMSKQFGQIQAVRGIRFDVHQGEIFSLLSPNGAGKTTTIKLLLGPADQLVDGVAWGTGSLPGNVSCVAIDPNQYPLGSPFISRSPLWKDTDNCPNDFVVDTTAAP